VPWSSTDRDELPPPKRPWWVLGVGLGSSIYTLAGFGLLDSFWIGRQVEGPSVLHAAAAVLFGAMTLLAVVSVVYWARRPKPRPASADRWHEE
jgi:hypothetical protein